MKKLAALAFVIGFMMLTSSVFASPIDDLISWLLDVFRISDAFRITGYATAGEEVVAESVSSVILYPTADAYVNNDHRTTDYRTTNYGKEVLIGVVTNQYDSVDTRSFLRFDLSSVPAGRIVSANFYLYRTDYTPTGWWQASVDARETTDGWTESGITWNNQPACGNALSTVSVSTVNKWYSWAVTNYVASEYVGDKIVSFCLKETYEDVGWYRWSSFWSKETAVKPFLYVTYIPEATTTSTTTTSTTSTTTTSTIPVTTTTKPPTTTTTSTTTTTLVTTTTTTIPVTTTTKPTTTTTSPTTTTTSTTTTTLVTTTTIPPCKMDTSIAQALCDISCTPKNYTYIYCICDSGSATCNINKYYCSNSSSNNNWPTYQCAVAGCTDSDGGKNYYTKGKVVDSTGSYEDFCIIMSTLPSQLKTLVEYYCNGTKATKVIYDCPYSCQDGACKNITTDTIQPSISNIQTIPSSPTTADEITIKATATDNQSNIQLCQIAIPLVGDVTADTALTYGDYKIYSDLGDSQGAWARVIVKNPTRATVDTVTINTGSYVTTLNSKLRIGVIRILALSDGTIVSTRLYVIKEGGDLYQDMTASDGAYDEKTEDVEKNIGKFSYQSTYYVFLKCKDAAGNWNSPVQRGFLVTAPAVKPKITTFSCSSIGSLKAQCTIGVENLDSSKRYYVYVAGSGKASGTPAAGATVFSGSDKSATVVVLTLKADTYQLGAWLFEGTNPDVIKPALAFWEGAPAEVVVS